jgi:hypothetical protein
MQPCGFEVIFPSIHPAGQPILQVHRCTSRTAAAPTMITFIKILSAPPTWKSEPIFAAPRYLIRAIAGEFRLSHYCADVRGFVAVGSAARLEDAERAAERHLAEGADAAARDLDVDATLSA